MGANRRYDAMAGELNAAAARPQPVSLTVAELDLANHPATELTRAVDVLAWVNFVVEPAQLSARVIAHTDKAVLVRFETRRGAVEEVWVWASAVTRR